MKESHHDDSLIGSIIDALMYEPGTRNLMETDSFCLASW